jgi:hypothetical protein
METLFNSVLGDGVDMHNSFCASIIRERLEFN